jgi:hypothetical protein
MTAWLANVGALAAAHDVWFLVAVLAVFVAVLVGVARSSE